jgi:hypothetical protein
LPTFVSNLLDGFQWIEYKTVHLAFSRLKGDRTGELPAEVLRALRSVGLVDGRVRRAT